MFSNTFFTILLLFFGITNTIKAQSSTNSYHNNKIIDENLLYYKAYNTKNNLSLPFISLNSNEKIKISFDYKGDLTDFNYKIIHCDRNWNESDINELDYIDGFIENQVTEYDNSFNTNINYYHYSIELPNRDINLKKSGNYKLVVYKNYNEDDIVFISHFYVVEPIVNISGKVRASTQPQHINTSHEIMFDIEYRKLKVFNPNSELKVYIWQNGDIYGKRHISPEFIRNNTLSFKYKKDNIFLAGNEFRNFSTENIKFLNRYVEKVEYNGNNILVNLFPTNIKSNKPYTYEKDINGFYIIQAENKTDPNTEADYTNIYFSLKMDKPLDKDIYVFGALSNWSIYDKFKMQYDYNTKTYNLNTLLKQGYYNYKYVIFDSKLKKIDKSFIDGNYYETENDYFVAVYYRDSSDNYDRLVGYQYFNSSTIK